MLVIPSVDNVRTRAGSVFDGAGCVSGTVRAVTFALRGTMTAGRALPNCRYKLLTDDSLPEAAQVDDLLSQGAADGIWTADGTTLLHVAAMYAKPAALVEQLCRAKPQQACIASKSLGYLPLHYGACNGEGIRSPRTAGAGHPPSLSC